MEGSSIAASTERTSSAENVNLHLKGEAKYSMVRLNSLKLSGPDWVHGGGRLNDGDSRRQ